MERENHIGKIIEQMRKERKLSLRDLALITGVSHQYLNLLERGYDQRSGKPISPTLDILKKIAKGLEISMDEFFEEESEYPGIPPGAFRVNRKYICMIPVVSRISAGDPQDPKDPRVQHWPVDFRMLKIYDIALNYDTDPYYLEVEGDSMQPLFNNGDYVLVSKTKVESGNIAVVTLKDNHTCLKKVQFEKDGQVILLSRNPKYEPILIDRKECKFGGKVLLSVGKPDW